MSVPKVIEEAAKRAGRAVRVARPTEPVPEPHHFCPACRAFRTVVYVRGHSFTCDVCDVGPRSEAVRGEDAARGAWSDERSEASQRLCIAQALDGPIRFNDWKDVTGLDLAQVRAALFDAAAHIVEERKAPKRKGNGAR